MNWLRLCRRIIHILEVVRADFIHSRVIKDLMALAILWIMARGGMRNINGLEDVIVKMRCILVTYKMNLPTYRLGIYNIMLHEMIFCGKLRFSHTPFQHMVVFPLSVPGVRKLLYILVVQSPSLGGFLSIHRCRQSPLYCGFCSLLESLVDAGDRVVVVAGCTNVVQVSEGGRRGRLAHFGAAGGPMD